MGRKTSTWFSVEAEDYLARGSDPKGLAWKLWTFLRSHNLDPQDFGHAYLVTAPRFLGYSFNPISFWYLYDRNRSLAAMILEVNNTFDERRMYLLRPQTSQHGTTTSNGEIVFSETWEKDFHVSPFNDRDGFYSLRAIDLFASGQTPKVDCTVTLMTTDQRPKLVARVWSTCSPSVAASMNRFQSLWFVLNWWWVGLTTDLRILREARKLWTKGLRIFYRPEVLKSSIGRKATPEEEVLEILFRSWLDKTTTKTDPETIVEYVAAVNSPVSVTFGTSNNQGHGTKNPKALVVRVISPSFYRSLVYYDNVKDAIKTALSDKSASERLLWVSDLALLRQLLDKAKPDAYSPGAMKSPASPNRYLQGIEQGISLIFRYAAGSDMTTNFELGDHTQLQFQSKNALQQYQGAVKRIKLSDTLAFSSTGILYFYWIVMWSTVLFLTFFGGYGLSCLVLRGDAGKNTYLLLWKLLLANSIHAVP